MKKKKKFNFDKGTKGKSGKGKYKNYYERIGVGSYKKYKCLFCGLETPSYSGICSHIQRKKHMKKGIVDMDKEPLTLQEIEGIIKDMREKVFYENKWEVINFNIRKDEIAIRLKRTKTDG